MNRFPLVRPTARSITPILLAAAFTLTACAVAPAQDAKPQAANAKPQAAAEIGLTIYSSADPAGFDPQKYISQQRGGYTPNYVWQVPGFGVVRETRTINLKRGVNLIDFTNVARFIDPTTVSLTDLNAAPEERSDEGAGSEGVSVLKQTFLFDLVSPDKLLDNYVDRTITVRVPTEKGYEQVTGKLLSHLGSQLVLETSQGLQLIPSGNAQVMLGKLPGGLITKPTLQWKLASNVSGGRKVRTSYQTAGITWRADYNLVLNKDDTKADLGAWVTILNLSGKSYDHARLKLIAGDVHRVQPRVPRPMSYAVRSDMAAVEKAGFQEKSFYSYHLYTLPRPTDIADNTTQQITLFPTAQDVKVDKVLVYYGLPEAENWGFLPQPRTQRNLGNQSNHKVDVYIRFKNSEQNNLGMPLPAGKVRVYKADEPSGAGDGPARGETLEFVGEDLIDHTPKDETLLIKTGQSFDIVGDRTQTNFHVDVDNKTMTESFRIELRNHKKQDVNVIVRENLYRWSNWEIVKHSDDFKKIDARTIQFPVTVPADGKKDVTYTVKYSW